jgi:quinol monooxygenase YgiN
MSNTFYTVLAILEAKSGKEHELADVLTALIDPTCKEDGCVTYELHRDPKNPGKFMFYENWTSAEAHAQHILTPHIKAWQAKMGELLTKPYEVTFWQLIRDKY